MNAAAEIDHLLQMRMSDLAAEEKARIEKGWTSSAEYYHARYIEAESIRAMLHDFFQGGK